MNLVEVIVRTKDESKAGFAAATASSEGFAARLTKVGMIGGAGLAAVGVASVVMAAKFDSAMEQIHTQAGVAQDQIGGLKSGVLALAGQVGFSPDSLAEALYHIESSFASVGIKGPQAMNMLKIAAEGAAVGHANLVDVTNALDAAIASGIPGVSNMSQAMGVLNATVGAGDMKMQDLADAFGTGMLAVVKGFGLSITDVGAALAVFGDNNIRGAQAGTELRMAVMALASPAKAGIKVLEGLGLTASQLGKDMQTGGLMKAVTDLKTHMDKAGLSAVQQGQVITEIFGKKAGTGVNILISQFDRLKSKYPDLAKGASQFGQAWEATKKTTAQQWKELESGAEALGIQIGEKLMPYVQKLLSFMLSHKSVFTDVAIGIAAVTLALTALSVILKGIALVSMLFNPIGLIITALAALAIGFTIAWKKSATFRDVIKDIGIVFLGIGVVVVQANKIIVMAFLDMVSAVIHGAAAAFGWIPGLGPKLKEAAAKFDGLKAGVNNAFDSMIGKMKDWQRGLEDNKNSTDHITTAIKGDFEAQKQAADDAKTGIFNLTIAIQNNGAQSAQAKTARTQLIKDLETAGVDASTARKDVDAYSKAVQTNGANSQQAAAARKQLINDILAASKNAVQGQRDLAAYTTAVKSNGSNSDAAKTARARLIQDLENAGLSAKQATQLVDGLTGSLHKVPKNTNANVSVHASGNGGMTFTEKVEQSISSGSFALGVSKALGGMITGGTPGKDSVLGMLMPGEVVVPTGMVNAGAVDHLRGKLPGFSGGGLVGKIGSMVPWLSGAETSFLESGEHAFLMNEWKHLQAAVHNSAAQKAMISKSSGASAGSSGPGGGAPSANAALARKLHPDWGSGAAWAAWNNTEMREAGWNQFARNPSSGAYGIPQALPPSKMGAAANPPQSNPTAQINWMYSYIKGRYGSPQNAWAHEQSAGWYAPGGATSSGWAVVGEHGRELIKVPGGATVYPNGASNQMLTAGSSGPAPVQLEISGGGQGAFDQFMLHWLRENARIKGGGSVQKAFGIGGK